MRKSKIRSARSHLGGIDPKLGIVPPAAASFDTAMRPENDAILREVLTPEELAQVAIVRQIHQNKRSRVRTREQQIQNDKRREQSVKTLQRDNKNVKSSSEWSRKRDKVFKQGRAEPLSPEEEFELTGISEESVGLQVDESLEDVEMETSEIEIEEEEEGLSGQEVPVPPTVKKRERKKLAPVSLEEASGDGGTPHVANTLGVNPKSALPRKTGRKKATTKKSSKKSK